MSEPTNEDIEYVMTDLRAPGRFVMPTEEPQTIAFLITENQRLSDECARLRAILRTRQWLSTRPVQGMALLERTATMSGVDGCIWCLAWQGNKHSAYCEVFAPDGRVKACLWTPEKAK